MLLSVDDVVGTVVSCCDICAFGFGRVRLTTSCGQWLLREANAGEQRSVLMSAVGVR